MMALSSESHSVQCGKVIKSSRHTSTSTGISTGSSSLSHVPLVPDPAHLSPENSPMPWCMETILALQRLAHWLRHNFVVLFLLICHYGEIFLFSGKCVSCLRTYVDIGQPHWCGHCDLGKQSKKALASGGLFCLAHAHHRSSHEPLQQYPCIQGFQGEGMHSAEFKNCQLSI